MHQNFFQRHRHRIAVAENDIAEAVTNQNNVDACLVNYTGGRIIVSGQANQTLTPLFTGFE